MLHLLRRKSLSKIKKRSRINSSKKLVRLKEMIAKIVTRKNSILTSTIFFSRDMCQPRKSSREIKLRISFSWRNKSLRLSRLVIFQNPRLSWLGESHSLERKYLMNQSCLMTRPPIWRHRTIRFLTMSKRRSLRTTFQTSKLLKACRLSRKRQFWKLSSLHFCTSSTQWFQQSQLCPTYQRWACLSSSW